MKKEYKNKIHFDFSIWNYEDITHKEITHILRIIPSKVYVKGERINPENPKISKQNGWILKSSLDKYVSFEDQLNVMLDLLEPKIEELQMLSEKHKCEFEFSLAIFILNQNESTPWVHLNKRYNDFIRKVDVEFDFDIYYPPEDEE
ncbi:DUF4279 domain-containing protein [Apibacter raozihei]|uniref:DUF4279 domain-containing protein n=1 Tax=Apibacter raozihei TaxID=2500547 RepID=UPI000FE2E3D0|nr:DUF4279 domain-containing protein [Apibacter raozihei]